jgi:flavin reductase (DIM6/NTAB) family NADH-FMN oxidoreductase RutF
MSKYIGAKLPPECLRALDGKDLERKFGDTYLIATTDADGSPRPSLLSAGEVLATDDQTIRLALWPGTRTATNLKRGSPVVVSFIAPSLVFHIRGHPRDLGFNSGANLERVEVKVESVEFDVHEGLPVVQGIRFTADDAVRAATLKDWARAHEALRAA